MFVHSTTSGESLLNLQVLVSDGFTQTEERKVILCQGDILKRAAILDASQEGAVKVSCCLLPLPDNYILFSLVRAAQHAASGSQVEN